MKPPAAPPQRATMTQRLPVVLWALTAVLAVASVAISAGRDHLSDIVLYTALPLLVATVGALVAVRQPGNAIGWIFSGFGVYLAAAEVAEGYGLLARDLGLPGGEIGSWVISWTWIGEIAVWAVVFLLFPDGRLPGRRWRLVVGVVLIGFSLAAPGLAFSSSKQDEFPGGVNPFAVQGPVPDTAFAAGMLVLFLGLAAAVVSFIRRLRRAQGIERQQLKWFAYAATAVGLAAPVVVVLWETGDVVQVAAGIGFNALPAAAGVAILKYRLYDIDLVINRTLVYTALTMTLAATYLGSVLSLQLLLSRLTSGSELSIAASTLGVAALFRPARSRIHRAVDRRFYRRRYDAGRTLHAFAARLRNEVDLEAVTADLREVASDAMQPAHVSLWLRETVTIGGHPLGSITGERPERGER